MSKVSASTLARRAAKTKNPVTAKRLRAEAAKLRRDNAVVGQTPAAQRRISQMRAASVDSMPLVGAAEQPGRGEIVGGYLAYKADEIAKLARKKGGVDAIQSQLEMIDRAARNNSLDEANKRVQKAAQQVNEQWRENIVTGFMARMHGIEQMTRSGLPDSLIVDGVTLARVVDALAAAGYTASGKKR